MNPEKVNQLCAQAERHYDPELPYHNWNHAQEVMANVVDIHRHFLGGTRQFGPATRIDIGPILIAAAHHDDGHEDLEVAQFASKEHYAAHLAEQDLTGHIDPTDIAAVQGMILATRFQAPRTTREEVVLHYADVWNMAAAYPVFYDHSINLWREYGRPEWGTFRQESERVISATIDESLYQRPISFCSMTGAWGADPWYFPTRARQNLQQFLDEPEPQV